jgi:predicted ribosome quality control (RQC) complex YloA/Tae2 family protein
MKKVITILLVFVFLAGITPVYSAPGKRGASDKAYEHASDEAVFNRVGDWFATRGKSEEEKQAIVAKRKAKRAVKRARKQAEKQKKRAEKEAKKAQKKIKDRMKGTTKR